MRYDVKSSANAAELDVEVELPGGLGTVFVVDPRAASFVEYVNRLELGRWVPVSRHADGWRAAECQSRPCRLRYIFHLGRAAHAIDETDTAAARGEALVAPASTWLLRPRTLPARTLRARMHVAVPPPLVFVTGLPPVAGAAQTYWVALLPFFLSPYSAFGRFTVETIRVGGADVEFAVAVPSPSEERARIRSWSVAAAGAVTSYFGRFPVDRGLVLVVPQNAGLHGQAMGGGGATVLLQVAAAIDLTDPAVDWQATHEMVHLAIPELPRSQIWLAEGLATYVEPLARASVGELTPESVWRDLVVGLPKGLPGPGDRGLDLTHTWARTYWGGALFAFLADLQIRTQSGGAQSLATALQGVLQSGGDMRAVWTMDRFITTCDRTLGRPILSDLYQRLGRHRGQVDLADIWRQLGVSLVAGQVKFDDAAPLAAIRRSMIGQSTR